MNLFNNVEFLFGNRIIIAPYTPRVKCSAEFVRLQSPELVERTNEWMAAFFGYHCMVKEQEVLSFEGSLIMTQKTFEAYKRICGEQ